MTVPRPLTLDEAREIIGSLVQRIEALEAENAALKEHVRQSSQNSSRPPSTDPATIARPPARAPSGRRPGAQPGHEAHARALVPVDEVDHVVPLRPTHCRGCGAALRGTDSAPRRQCLRDCREDADRSHLKLRTMNARSREQSVR